MRDCQQSLLTRHIPVTGLLQLVAVLSSVNRFTSRRLQLQGDVPGTDHVLLWQSDDPFAVDFPRGGPGDNSGEISAGELVE